MKRSLHSLSSNSGGPNSGRRRKQTNHNNSFQLQRPKSSHGRASHPRSNNTTANSILSNIRYDKSVRLEEPAIKTNHNRFQRKQQQQEQQQQPHRRQPPKAKSKLAQARVWQGHDTEDIDDYDYDYDDNPQYLSEDEEEEEGTTTTTSSTTSTTASSGFLGAARTMINYVKDAVSSPSTKRTQKSRLFRTDTLCDLEATTKRSATSRYFDNNNNNDDDDVDDDDDYSHENRRNAKKQRKHKRNSSAEMEDANAVVDLCGENSDTEGDTIYPPRGRHKPSLQHKSSSTTTTSSSSIVKEEEPSFRTTVKNITSRSPNRALLLGESDDDEDYHAFRSVTQKPKQRHHRPTKIEQPPTKPPSEEEKTNNNKKKKKNPSHLWTSLERAGSSKPMGATARNALGTTTSQKKNDNNNHSEQQQRPTLSLKKANGGEVVDGKASSSILHSDERKRKLLQKSKIEISKERRRKSAPPLPNFYSLAADNNDADGGGRATRIRSPNGTGESNHQPIELDNDIDIDNEAQQTQADHRQISPSLGTSQLASKKNGLSADTLVAIDPDTTSAPTPKRRDPNEFFLPESPEAAHKGSARHITATDDSMMLRHAAEEIESQCTTMKLRSSTKTRMHIEDEDPLMDTPEAAKRRTKDETFRQDARKRLSFTKQNSPRATYSSRKRTGGTKITPGASFFRSPTPKNNRSETTTTREPFSSYEDDSIWSQSTGPETKAKRRSLESTSVASPDDTPNTKRRSKRLKKTPKKPETIDILSSDDDSGSEETGASFYATPEDVRIVPNLVRIAIGKKVFSSECQVTLDEVNGVIRLEYENTFRFTRSRTTGERSECHIRLDSVQRFSCYRVPEDVDEDPTETKEEKKRRYEPFSFLSMNVELDDLNMLSKFSNSYKPDGSDSKCKFIVLDFREGKDMSNLVERIKKLGVTNRSITILREEQKEEYSEALIEHSRKEFRSRYEITPKKKKSKFLAGKPSDFILLVYPFAGDQREIEAAAEGLTEASGENCKEDTDEETSKERDIAETSGESINSITPTNEELAAEIAQGKVRQRAHYVTIRVEDFERLEPTEWLNDSLLDFWMQWISRDVKKQPTDFHFFTSHFYTTLADEGPKAVESWTAKKNIDIFKKKLIFVPINKDLHWSLCVVVNPGAIMNSLEKKPDDPLACLIFLDSLNMHRKHVVQKKICAWLNSEWARIRSKSQEQKKSPFHRNSLRIFSPKVPHQNNSWDCGVFVCRYAYAIFRLRLRDFTFGDAGLCSEGEKKNNPFYHLITDTEEFDFDMSDIRRFREELKTLVEKLSGIYLKWKKVEREEQRKAKAALVENSEKDPPSSSTSDGANLNGVQIEPATSIESDGKENIMSGSEERKSSNEAYVEKEPHATCKSDLLANADPKSPGPENRIQEYLI